MLSVGERWSAETAWAVARAAAGRLGLADQPLDLIRMGTNGVFGAGAAVLRVSPPDESEALVREQLAFARWLVGQGFPTSRPLLEDPVLVDGSLVTLWSRLRGEPGKASDRRAFGELMRFFHALTAAYDGPLPAWEPLGRLGRRLDTVTCDFAFTEADRETLGGWRDELVRAAGAMAWELPPGPPHGDVHTGNVIVAPDGLYLIDLDRIARGPREWDLTQQVAASTRFGDARGHLDAFAGGYGWDIRGWPGAEALVRLRMLFMTSWLVTMPRTPVVRAEIANRMEFWRDPGTRAQLWRPV